MESGPGWMNVLTTSTNISGNVSYLTPLQKIVLAGALSQYAYTGAEQQLFQGCNITQLIAPFLLADQSQGFNAGVTLLGLLFIIGPLSTFCSNYV